MSLPLLFVGGETGAIDRRVTDRSRSPRIRMFAHKPTLESVLRAIPAFQLDYFADAGPNPGEKLVARPKSSSAASASSAGPSSTPVRARPPPGPVPSHTYRTPQQQMSGGYAGSLPTPQSDFASRFGGQGGGAYASTQRAQATATSRGAKGEQVRRSDGHGAEREDEKIWEGPLVIPAHGGGEVIVFMEGEWPRLSLRLHSLRPFFSLAADGSFILAVSSYRIRVQLQVSLPVTTRPSSPD